MQLMQERNFSNSNQLEQIATGFQLSHGPSPSLSREPYCASNLCLKVGKNNNKHIKVYNYLVVAKVIIYIKIN